MTLAPRQGIMGASEKENGGDRMKKSILLMGSAAFCEQLRPMLDRLVPPSFSVGTLAPGRDWAAEINLLLPELVITETELEGASCFDVIERVGSAGNFTTQFIVCGRRDFDALYRAMKCGAADYLLLPPSAESLSAALQKFSVQPGVRSVESAARRFYLSDRGMDLLRREPISREQINAVYSAHFVDGLYKMLFIKFDIPFFHKEVSSRIQLDMNHVEQTVRDFFGDWCADIIIIHKADGIMAVLNYKPVDPSVFDARLGALFEVLRARSGVSGPLGITLCVSGEVGDPCEVWKLKEQVRDAEWSRMDLGINRIIRWQDHCGPLKGPESLRLEKLMTEITNAVSVLDVARFRRGIEDMYALPRETLLSREFRFAVKRIIYCPFEIYWDTISKFANPVEKSDTLAYLSHLCTTFQSHESLILSEYTALLERIADSAEKKYSAAVSNAIAFISDNLDKRITLASAAERVGLSSCYLSSLFKKETGTNFSDFVNSRKAESAVNMLTYTTLTISEIAFRLGFDTVQAFSKHFKATLNVTPTKYRQLHGSVDGLAIPRKNTTQADLAFKNG